MRYFIEISYRGTAYHGWQVQQNAHSVQAEIEKALSTISREKIEIMGSGRTDTGVHAEQQFAHFDCALELNRYRHIHQLNVLLPPDISIQNIYPVDEQAHARFDAHKRSYQYRMAQHKNPFLHGLVHFDPQEYSIEKMNQGAQLIQEYQDFEAFSKVNTQVNHFRCEIFNAHWKLEGDLLVFHVSANRFLRGMVRALVGTLLEMGKEKLNLNELRSVIESKDRSKAGRAMPPQGLFLTEVAYPYPLIPLS